MIYAALPIGWSMGWGIMGKEIALALSRLTDIRVACTASEPPSFSDEFDRLQLERLTFTPPSGTVLDGPIIQAVHGDEFQPFVPEIPPPAHVGFTVFEANSFPPSLIEWVGRNYRSLATGSSYCAEVLRSHGLGNVSTVLHGVDTQLFQPRDEPRSFLQDRFVVFSGGKFEFRKGQDIVIRAFKVFQDRHADVMLVNCWHNRWAATRDTMKSSKLIDYHAPTTDSHRSWISELLASNGIDLARVITIGKRDHRLLPLVYHATDLGLFPNRVEGGTNMVLMEYMACGKPVIASFNSGHKDILRPENAVLIEGHSPMLINGLTPFGRKYPSTLYTPNLDETIDKLEWCYQHRDELKRIGQQAAADMRQFTWKRVAEGLLRAVRQVEAGLYWYGVRRSLSKSFDFISGVRP